MAFLAWENLVPVVLQSGRGFSFLCARQSACAATLDATSLSQQEVFKDEFALATDKRPAANTACYVLKDRLRSGFDFDDVIERLAVRAREGIE